MTEFTKLQEAGEAPEWLQEDGYFLLTQGYLQAGETPRAMYKRVADAAASRVSQPELAKEFFDIIWKNWLCLATPVAANMGTDRGLPISCNSIHIGDNLFDILGKGQELGLLSKYGAGVGIYIGDLRGRGTAIRGTGGHSDGVLAWTKVYESVMLATKQGQTRRGAAAAYLPIEHPDAHSFLDMRKATGDENLRARNLHHAYTIGDGFMQSLVDGDKAARAHWQALLQTRFETGEPFILFKDNANRQLPQEYLERGREVTTSNICTEIMLASSPSETFVCCLSSMNLARWDEWRGTKAVYLAIKFLDGVMSEYIAKARNIPGFENAVRFAEAGRPLGLGALGWHSLLQAKGLAFDSFEAMMLNSAIFRHIQAEAELATRALGATLGSPEWCKTTGRRNTHLLAIAPTVSNSVISGRLSAGIEPWTANVFVESSKGTTVVKNRELAALLKSKGKDTAETWSVINKDKGSVQGLDCLSSEEKAVYLTAREINQFALVKQAAQRQKWIDQGQSLNLFFGLNSDPKYIHEVHMEAWQTGVKSLYYMRAESALRGDLASRSKDECAACEG